MRKKNQQQQSNIFIMTFVRADKKKAVSKKCDEYNYE